MKRDNSFAVRIARLAFAGLVTLTQLLAPIPLAPLSRAYAAETVVAPGAGLQAAIAAAAPGDTLILSAGEYTTSGQVVIDKALSITGAGIDTTVIKTTSNTVAASINTSLTTGWFRVAPTGTLTISGLTLDGEESAGLKTGAGIYASGPLHASGIRVTDVKFASYAGTGIVLIGTGHEVVGCTIDDIERLGLYIGAGSANNAPSPGPEVAYGTLVDGCTFVGAGAGNFCQYSMEVGRSGRALVRNIDVSGFSGVTTGVNPWNSAGLLVDSYYGSGVASLTLETSTFHDSGWGVEVGYPDQPRDTVLHMNDVSFERVGVDLNVSGATNVVSMPSGLSNEVVDRDWQYHWFDATGTTMTPPPALPDGFINWRPVANPDAYTVPRNATFTSPVSGVLANDADADDETLTVAPVSGVTTGALTLEPNGDFAYTPPRGYAGVQQFTYRASDWLDSAVNTVTLTVANTIPLAVDDSWSVRQGELLVGGGAGVLGNDTDENGDALTVRVVDGVSHGSLMLQPDGTFVYQPASSFVGDDSFTYEVSDGEGSSAVATVTISVTNSVPVALPDAYVVPDSRLLVVSAPGVTGNDSDGDSDRVTAEVLDPPAFGALVLAANGSFMYVPRVGFPGTDTFTYRASDGKRSSNTATVTITGTPIPYPTQIALTSVSATLPAYGATYTVGGALYSEGIPLAGRRVVLQIAANAAGPFSDTSAVATTAADGSFSIVHLPRVRTAYRVSFAGEGMSYESDLSSVTVALPRAYLGRPVAPKVMYRGRAFKMYGYIKPRHSAGTYPVRIYRYKYVSGRWRSYGFANAKASNYASYTKYIKAMSLPSRGRWRIRAYHPADAGHAAGWSTYRYITVR